MSGGDTAGNELDALSTVWREHGLSPDALAPREDGTLSASDRQLTLAGTDGAGPLPGATDLLVLEPLTVGEPLGQGGMGVVERAQQLALRREVAVKRVREGAEPKAMQNLLKEAWIGGALQHPNLVPVHALAELDGQPAVVMKRIDGETWRTRLQQTTAERSATLDAELDILIAVCHAMELAHARGILHLDLKPDNVMVGHNGEVYVVDWGLAAGHGEGAPSWLPPSHLLRSVAGTPDYMAPELAAGAAAHIGPHSDVYLLGATLHEVVTGAPPHRGDTAVQKLYRAYLSVPPEYGPDVDPELCELLHRAMAADRGARFERVVDFREALEAFRAHRHARELTSQARHGLQRLLRLLGTGRPDEAEVWQAFGACRFALDEAQKLWAGSDDDPTHEVRQSLYEAMAGWALDGARIELAQAYLDELFSEADALSKRVAEQRAEAAREEARERSLQQLAFQEDIRLGVPFRRRIGLALGTLFLLVNTAMGAVTRLGWATLGYREMLATGLLTVGVLGPFAWFTRRQLFRNRANAALFTICMGCFFALEALWAFGAVHAVPFGAALALTPVFYLLAFGTVAMLVDTRFVPAALLQLVAAFAAAAWPDHTYELIGLFGGLAAIQVGYAVPPGDDEPEPAR